MSAADRLSCFTDISNYELAFRQPFNRGFQLLLTRLVAFGFAHPLHVFPLIAWLKFSKVFLAFEFLAIAK